MPDAAHSDMSHAPGRLAGLWRRPWAGLVLLMALCAAVYLPGVGSMPVVDRDEARFAQASRQMLESGDWLVPRVQDRARLNKPPLSYWAQAASTRVWTGGDVAGDSIWMYRVPSLLAALAAVLATWRIGATLYGPRRGLLAAVLLAASPVMFWEARQARSDMLLLALTTCAMWALLACVTRIERGQRTRWALTALWVCVALGTLTKGPITLLLVALAAAAYSILRQDRRLFTGLRWGWGLAGVAACILPWLAGVAMQVGWGTYFHTIYEETLGRSLEPKEGHSGPPGYHLLLLGPLLFPASLLALPALVRAARRGLVMSPALETSKGWTARKWSRLKTLRARRRPEAFVLAWIVPAWVIFELISTKLPHYTMPLLPGVAILLAHATLSTGPWAQRMVKDRGVRTGVVVWAFGIAAFAAFTGFTWGLATPLAGWNGPLGLPPGTQIVIAVTLGIGLSFAYHALRHGLKGRFRAAMALALCSFVLCGAFIGTNLARAHVPFVSRQLAGELNSIDPAAARPVGLIDFHEDSMIFETRGRAQRLTLDDLDEWAAKHADGLVVAPRRLAAERGWPELGEALGFNYSKGRRVDLVIVEAKGVVIP